MTEIKITLTEPEAACLQEMAQHAGISVEEAARRAVLHVLREVMPVEPRFYANLRSQMFWEHYKHLNSILRQAQQGGGER